MPRNVLNAKPSVHLPAAHFAAVYVLMTSQGLSVCRIDSQQQATLATGADRHSSVDHEGDSTEHSLLAEVRFGLEDLPDPPRHCFVVRHTGSIERDPADGDLCARCRPGLPGKSPHERDAGHGGIPDGRSASGALVGDERLTDLLRAKTVNS